MAQGNKILFWFRESFLLYYSGLLQPLNEASGYIPVFCFDQKESSIIFDSWELSGNKQHWVQRAETLPGEDGQGRISIGSARISIKNLPKSPLKTG